MIKSEKKKTLTNGGESERRDCDRSVSGALHILVLKFELWFIILHARYFFERRWTGALC